MVWSKEINAKGLIDNTACSDRKNNLHAKESTAKAEEIAQQRMTFEGFELRLLLVTRLCTSGTSVQMQEAAACSLLKSKRAAGLPKNGAGL